MDHSRLDATILLGKSVIHIELFPQLSQIQERKGSRDDSFKENSDIIVNTSFEDKYSLKGKEM